LTRLTKQLLSLLVVAGSLSPAAFAGNKENPKDVLQKSFQQANLWTQGPVKLSADVTLPKPDGTNVSLHYIASWAGPDKWRVEWPENGLNQVTVLNNNKLSYASGQPNPLVPLVQFESAVAALDGGDPAGPYMMPPIDFTNAKFDTSKKKIGAIDAKCYAFGDPQEIFCIDPATNHLLSVAISVHAVEIGSFEYSDYATNGNVQYPQSIKVTYTGKPIVEAKMTISRGDKFADTLFAAPDKATSYDWPSCADVDKNFTPPHVTKSALPKMSDAARKANKYGLVWVMATVSKDGSVTKATVIGGDPDLNTSATDAVQQYKFSPYMRCAQAAEFQKLVIVPFLPPQKFQDGGVLPSR
jgi:Gram-negative bacterial TonB protein C-terminal